MSPYLLGVTGLVLVTTCGVVSMAEYSTAREREVPRDCQEFAARPSTGWVTLEGCELDFVDALVGDEAGFERLSDRLEGVSRTLHSAPPAWRQVVAPLSSASLRYLPARAALVLTDPDLLGLLNRFERASDAERAGFGGLDALNRWRRAGRLQGLGVKDEGAIQGALGRAAVPGLILLRPGGPPPAAAPWGAVVLGLLGVAALVSAGVGRVRQRDSTATATELQGDEVKVELGELEALRAEQVRGKGERGSPPT